MLYNDDNINQVIYSLGNQFQLYQNKWAKVKDQLLEDHNIVLSRDAIRKRYKRYKRNTIQATQKMYTEEEVQNILEMTLAERANQAVSKPQAHKPDYKNNVPFKAENVLIISDTHIPFVAKGYLNWVLELRDEYKCDTVIHIGDILDQCAVSAWMSDPDGLTAGNELLQAKNTLRLWYEKIPDMKICLGNHDIRHMTSAYKAGLSINYLRHFNEIYDVDWEWNWSYLQSGNNGQVLYTHGSEKGGQYAHINLSKEEGVSTVIGHTHSHAGTMWFKTRLKQWFALNVGCAIDENSYAFAYGKHKAYKCIIGAGLVLNNGTDPRFIPYGLS